jgi:5'-nucleotidase / UDP-sugar diphosphatase
MRRRTIPARVLFALATMLLASACGTESDAPDLSGVDVRLTVLHTGDLHSRLFPYDMVPQYTDEELGLHEENGPFGGAARLATLIKAERARSGRSLHLDSGDYFQGAPVFNQFKGEVEVRVLSELGVDAAVAGNHEFDEGARNFATQLEKWSNYSTLAANYEFHSSNDPWNSRLDALVNAHNIFDLKGLKVGVIGMGNLSSITSIEEADNSMDVDVRETISTVMHYSSWLKTQVDIVIVLTHLSLDDDVDIARLCPDVDIVIGGHLHIALDPVKVVQSEVVPGKRVIVSHAGAFAKYLQRLDFVIRDGEVIAHGNTLLPIDSSVPEDGDMLDMLEDYERELGDTIDLDRSVGHTVNRLRRFGTTGGDSPLGNLVAEAMQYRSGIETDFGMTNSLGIRTDIQGPADGASTHEVTVEELYNVLPFDNTITTMFLSGTEVQELFNYVTERSTGRGCNTQVQVSSARFVMNCSSEKAEQVTVGGSWSPCERDNQEDPDRDCPFPEICSAGRCGRQVYASESYELATNNYIAGGGSGFSVLENNTTQIDSGISMRDAVEFFMLELSEGGSVDLNSFYPDGDGRITPKF